MRPHWVGGPVFGRKLFLTAHPPRANSGASAVGKHVLHVARQVLRVEAEVAVFHDDGGDDDDGGADFADIFFLC